MAKVNVSKGNDSESTFEFKENDPSLLDALQANGVEILYHCREGFCGACRCKLKEGSVEYSNEPLAFVRRGEILTCCSKPTSDIKIELL